MKEKKCQILNIFTFIGKKFNLLKFNLLKFNLLKFNLLNLTY